MTQVTIGKEQQSKPKYPYFAKFRDTDKIVLMQRHNDEGSEAYGDPMAYGVVVKGDQYHNIGHQTGKWVLDQFTPFNGTLTIKSV